MMTAKDARAVFGVFGIIILLLRLVWTFSHPAPNEHIKQYLEQRKHVESSVYGLRRID